MGDNNFVVVVAVADFSNLLLLSYSIFCWIFQMKSSSCIVWQTNQKQLLPPEEKEPKFPTKGWLNNAPQQNCVLKYNSVKPKGMHSQIDRASFESETEHLAFLISLLQWHNKHKILTVGIFCFLSCPVSFIDFSATESRSFIPPPKTCCWML